MRIRTTLYSFLLVASAGICIDVKAQMDISLSLVKVNNPLGRGVLGKFRSAFGLGDFENYGYLMTGFSDLYIDNINKYKGRMDFLIPNYFVINNEGNVIQKTDKIEKINNISSKNSIKVLPRFMNDSFFDDFDAFFTPEKMDQATSQIIGLMQDYPGLNFNFEAVNPNQKDLHTEFICNIKNKLPDKLVTVAVAPQITMRGDGISIHKYNGVYDYKKLGECADRIIVMNYDYVTASNTVPQSNNPIWWSEASIKHTKSLIEPDKIIYGMPLYGISWNLTVKDNFYPLYRSTQKELEKYSIKPSLAPDSKSKYVVYKNDKDEDIEIWFEDSESIKLRTEMAERLGIGGRAFWSIGGEDMDIWE
jgi:spore germination protein